MISEICLNKHLPSKAASGRSKNMGADAFGRLYQKYTENIGTLVRSRIRKPCDAEDLVQDIFLKIWEYWDHIDEDRPVKSLLYRIALNAVSNYNTHERVIKRFESYWAYSQKYSLDSPESCLFCEEINCRIESILQNWPAKQENIFRLFWEKGLSRQQIAAKKKLSVRTVDNQIYRAKKKLKRQLISY